MKESNYWLRILKEIIDFKTNNEELEWLLNESNELSKKLLNLIEKNPTFKTLRKYYLLRKMSVNFKDSFSLNLNFPPRITSTESAMNANAALILLSCLKYLACGPRTGAGTIIAPVKPSKRLRTVLLIV